MLFPPALIPSTPWSARSPRCAARPNLMSFTRPNQRRELAEPTSRTWRLGTLRDVQIQEVLSRRTDLSTFVVHLCRDREAADGTTTSAANALRAIIAERTVEALTAMGWGYDQDDEEDEARQTQRVVCFSETPLEHVYSLLADIEGRQIELRPYGLALTKPVARRRGIGPVWYVDMTPSGHDWLAVPLRELKRVAIESENFHAHPMARLLPFFEWMGGPFPGNPIKKEFWWEREWRHAGQFGLSEVWEKIIWLCPADEHDAFRALVNEATPQERTPSRAFIDPRWGVEEIIAHLAGFEAGDVSVFAASPGHEAPVEPPPPF